MAETAGTLVCDGCGATVPNTPGACPYCGSPIVVPVPRGGGGPAAYRTFCPRCGNLYPTEAQKCPHCPPYATDAKGGRCPRCGGDLEPQTMGTVTADRCVRCKGLWFDGDELGRAVDLTTHGVSRDEAMAARRVLPVWNHPVEEPRYLACVRCGERMTRRQVAPRTGVIVDICRDHGVWFDEGEFEQFAAFSKAGGLEVFRYDGIAEAEARRRDPGSLPSGPDPMFGGTRSLPYPIAGDTPSSGGAGWLIPAAIYFLFRLIR